MVEHEVNKLDNFICGWYLTDPTICDRIIEHFNDSDCKVDGMVGSSAGGMGVNKEVKNSIDLQLTMIDSHLMNEYVVDNLQPVVNEYRKKYIWADQYAKWQIVESPNIQHYAPDGGFYVWHCERSTLRQPASSRHLVFMTYLNDVDDGGETEFYYQKVKIKPTKGLTLIWPSDWTFTHRGIPSKTQNKYVITGWFNYVE